MSWAPSEGIGPVSDILRIRNGNENAPLKRSWLRQREKPLTTISISSGCTTQTGKRVNTTPPARGGTTTS